MYVKLTGKERELHFLLIFKGNNIYWTCTVLLKNVDQLDNYLTTHKTLHLNIYTASKT